jgi:hypothetical protein
VKKRRNIPHSRLFETTNHLGKFHGEKKKAPDGFSKGLFNMKGKSQNSQKQKG